MTIQRYHFTVLTDGQIVHRGIYRTQIWRPALREHRHLVGRRAWLDALATLYDFHESFFWPNGRPYVVPDIDEVFPDPENRWLSAFLKADASGNAPAFYCRSKERLRLIALYCTAQEALARSSAFNTPSPARKPPRTRGRFPYSRVYPDSIGDDHE